MFRKRISSLLVALVALDATSALGLGLGEITLRSALNEPLKAEIRLRGTDDLGSDQIIVRLAPSADFDRSGIERLYALTEMRFEVKTAASGEGVVYLRTDQPVREPYLDFLLEVRWPNGRVLREYTVLLDLPTYTTAPPPEVKTPVTRAPARPSVTPRSDGGGAWSGGNTYGVQSGDTLWSIAARTRGDGVPVQQMLEALHQDNPEAFVNGDINRLRTGAVLRIQAELSSGSGAGAQPSAPDADAGGEQQSTGASSEPPADAGSERPYLRLTGDTAADAGGGSAGGEPGGSGTGSVTDDLATVQETLSAKERENAELASRVKALEDQVKDYQRVVDLKSEGMAAAQQSAGAATAPSVPAAAPVAPSAPSAPSAPEEEPGVLAAVLENGIALGAAVIAAFLATLGFLVVRRRRSAPGYAPLPSASQRFRSSVREEAGPEPSAIEPVVPPVRQAPVAVEPTPVPVVAVVPIMAEAPVAPETPPAALSARPLDLSKATPAVLPDEPHDPLAEADMFVAYGRHERAMEVLRVALEQDPEQIDVRLKLMEILATRNAQEEFLAEYDRVLALGGDDDVQVARTIAIETGHPHWLSELDAPAGIQSADTVAAPSLALSRSLAPLVEEDHEPELSSLDLDLHSPVPEPATGEFDLDLDASLDEAALDSVELDVLPADDHGEFGDLELASLLLDEPEPASDAAWADQPSTLREELPLALDVATDEDTVHLDFDLPGVEPLAEPVGLPSAPTEEDVADIDLLEGTDEVETRLELAKAFIEMGDSEGARDILEEVVAEGTEAQRASASALLDTLNPG